MVLLQTSIHSFGEGNTCTGKVVVSIGLEADELKTPTVDSILSSDKRISGKAEAKASVVVKVSSK